MEGPGFLPRRARRNAQRARSYLSAFYEYFSVLCASLCALGGKMDWLPDGPGFFTTEKTEECTRRTLRYFENLQDK